MSLPKTNRRRFLQSAGALAAPLVVSSKVLGRDGQASPNETLQIGIIGLGGRSNAIEGGLANIPHANVVALCDCFKPRVDARVKKAPQAKGYTDFREMIEKENLDGVAVETTTHARAWITCHAMAMGMDAYIEKPMSLTIAEGREMVDVARKHKCVTQVGTQQRSIPLNNWASDLVQNGAIGKVKAVLAPNFVGPVRWDPKPAEEMPDGGSDDWWEIWTNQAEMRPYRRELHYGWNRWWAYDGGGRCFGVTGWGTHSYDQINRGLGTNDTGPVAVLLEEPVKDMDSGKFDPRKPDLEETGAAYYRMARNVVGPRAKVRMKFENGTELRLELDADWGPGLGCIFVGENGKIEINRDKVAANPKELLESPDKPDHLKVPETQPHIENWLECIKTREKCTADIEYGQRSSTLCYLVNIVRDVGQVGKWLEWDPVEERFPDCEEGNRLLSRPRRQGYELPT
jgi:predicted dehydrogenase